MEHIVLIPSRIYWNIIKLGRMPLLSDCTWKLLLINSDHFMHRSNTANITRKCVTSTVIGVSYCGHFVAAHVSVLERVNIIIRIIKFNLRVFTYVVALMYNILRGGW